MPFGATFDGDSEKDGKVTLRERDSMTQVRLPIADLPRVLKGLCDETLSWAAVVATYPGAAAAASADGGASNAAAAAPAAAASSSAAASLSASPATTEYGFIAPGKSARMSVGVTLEGVERPYGRFARPADM